MTFNRIAAAAIATSSAALMATAPSALAAPAPAPAKPAAKVWVQGTYTPGKAFDVYATCSKATTVKATVTGPRGMKAVLTPVKKGEPTLKGSLTVPTALKGSWVKLHLVCKDGSAAQTTITRTGAKPAPAPKPKPAPAPAPTPKPAPAPKPAPKPAPVKAIKAWTTGSLKPGATIQVFADNVFDKAGKPATTATVVGPRGMKATLKPVSGKTYLQGAVVVPQKLQGSWVKLTVVAPNGQVAKVTVKR